MSGGTGRRRKPPVGEEGNEQYSPQTPPAEPYPQYQTYQQPEQESYDYDWRQQSAAPAPPAYETPAYEAHAQPPSPAYQPPHFPQQPQAPQYEQYEQQHEQQPGQQSRYEQPAQYEQPQRYEQPPQHEQPAQYEQYQAYQQQPAAAQPLSAQPAPGQPPSAQPAAAQSPPASDYFGSGSYEIPQQTHAAPSRPRPAPRPEPRPEPAPAAPPPAPAPAPSTAAAAPPPAAAPEFEFEFDPADESGDSAPPVTGNRPADQDGYRPGDFSFVDEADNPDVNGWLSFSESRADSRAERVRKLRSRLIVLVIVLALVAAGVGVYAWLGGSVPGLTGQAAPPKSTILFRLDDAKGDAVGDALLATEHNGTTSGTASGTGAIVVIPAQMQINSQGFGSQTFGGDMAADQPPAGADEVSSTLGVTPDGVRDMDETTFGIFIDNLGGISLTTNTSIPASTADPKGVTQGTVTLSGVQAVAYATYTASGEAATAQSARFGQVLNALMAKLPTESSAVQAYLNQLGLIPDPSLPLSKLSPILAALAAQENAGAVTVTTLPLTSGNALNETAASSVVSKLLGGTVSGGATAGQAARVLVQNGTGASSSSGSKLMASAQAKLTDAGYTYSAGDSVATQSSTKIEIAKSSEQSVAEQVAASLGLSGSAVQVVSGLSSADDVTVVLGQDWTSLSAD